MPIAMLRCSVKKTEKKNQFELYAFSTIKLISIDLLVDTHQNPYGSKLISVFSKFRICDEPGILSGCAETVNVSVSNLN